MVTLTSKSFLNWSLIESSVLPMYEMWNVPNSYFVKWPGSLHEKGMLTFEWSCYVLEIPNDVCTMHSQNRIDCSTLSQILQAYCLILKILRRQRWTVTCPVVDNNNILTDCCRGVSMQGYVVVGTHQSPIQLHVHLFRQICVWSLFFVFALVLQFFRASIMCVWQRVNFR